MARKSQYIVRLTEPHQWRGEYAGGKTLTEARREARRFVEQGCSGSIVYFTFGPSDPQDGRMHTVERFGGK